jgi:hypothetical protein
MRVGIGYEQSTLIKSDIYVAVLPLINSGRMVMMRSERLIHQFATLERVVAFGSNREKIDHPRDMHDDLANAVAGAAALAAHVGSAYGNYDVSMKWISGGNESEEERRNAQYRAQFANHLRNCGISVWGL